MQQNQIQLIQQLIAQGKPIPFSYNGRTFYLNPDQSAVYHLKNSISKIADLVQLINEDAKTILDIGANCGLFAAFAAMKLPNADIFAFEPAPDLVPVMQQNFKGLNVSLQPVAVSDQTGEQTLYVNPASQQTNSLKPEAVDLFAENVPIEEEIVWCTTLDDFADENSLQQIDVMKVDVQGFEGAVFRGARSVMPHVQQLFVESIWPDLDSVMELIPMGIHYGFRYAALINPVYMGADVLFSRTEITSTKVVKKFELTPDLLKRTWF